MSEIRFFNFSCPKGSNILLQRLMIQNNMLEQIALFTFDTEVNPCMVTYVIYKYFKKFL